MYNITDSPKIARILIAPDKFKGSLTATEVADALAKGIRSTVSVTPVQCEILPLADGGDGSVDAAVWAGFTRHTFTAAGPTSQLGTASLAFDGTTAVVEVANTCGLGRLTDETFQPMEASSQGFGEALRFALGLHPAKIVLALGGSASTDGGMGMLAALGFTFLDAQGTSLRGSGANLARIASIRREYLPALQGVELTFASDVTNSLLGPDGAAAVFGPQKGASPEQVAALNAGLAHLVSLLPSAGFTEAAELASREGAGSAGGVGYACLLLGAQQVSGAEFFLDLLDFDARVEGCDLVITGEGSLDEQTLCGKLPAVVARRSGVRSVVAVVGRSQLAKERWADLPVTGVYQLAEYTWQDPSKDPRLSAELLRQIGQDIGEYVSIQSNHVQAGVRYAER